jgi:hypothetical protein
MYVQYSAVLVVVLVHPHQMRSKRARRRARKAGAGKARWDLALDPILVPVPEMACICAVSNPSLPCASDVPPYCTVGGGGGCIALHLQ